MPDDTANAPSFGVNVFRFAVLSPKSTIDGLSSVPGLSISLIPWTETGSTEWFSRWVEVRTLVAEDMKGAGCYKERESVYMHLVVHVHG